MFQARHIMREWRSKKKGVKEDWVIKFERKLNISNRGRTRFTCSKFVNRIVHQLGTSRRAIILFTKLNRPFHHVYHIQYMLYWIRNWIPVFFQRVFSLEADLYQNKAWRASIGCGGTWEMRMNAYFYDALECIRVPSDCKTVIPKPSLTLFWWAPVA